MIARLRAIAAFWYDFVIGDDWRVAVGVVAALALTYGLSRSSVPSWWVLPVVVIAAMLFSLRRSLSGAKRPPP